MTSKTRALPELLNDLLLPGVLQQAPERLGARGCIWFGVGSEGRKLWPDAATSDVWKWVPTSEPVPPAAQRGAVWALADHLWDIDEKRLDTPQSCRPLLAVADPVANVITLSWRWFPADETGKNERHLRRLLGSRVEAFLGKARDNARRIFQRPALHLVVLGDEDEPPPELGVVIREILAQTGRYLPDFQARWLRFPSGSDGVFLRRLLGFHIPWPVWPRINASRLSPGEIEAISGVVETVGDKLEGLAAEKKDPFEIVIEARQAVTALRALDLDSGTQGTTSPGVEVLRSRGQRTYLSVSLAARQWQNSPVAVPLAPLTMIAGNNASGKTTLAEALSFAFTGLSRLRAPQPYRATVWEDDRPGQSGRKPPSLSMLRLQADERDPGARAPGALDAKHLLALFADDSDLAAAKPGDLSIVTWVGFPGLQAPSIAVGKAGRDLAGLLAQLFERHHAIESTDFRRRWAAESGAGRKLRTVSLEEGVHKALTAALAEKIEELEDEVHLRTKEESEAGNTGRSRKDGEGEELKKLEKDLELLRRDLADLSEAGQKVSASLMRRQLDLLLEPAYDPTRPSRNLEAWLHFKSLDQELGGKTALWRRAELVALEELSKLGRALRGLSEQLARRLFAGDLEEFEREIRGFLSQQSQPFLDEAWGLKPNTAAVVRLGQASRLARWLATTGSNWPLLVIDEPTLGQDEASCARALVRYLRLMRKAEAARCLARFDETADLPANAVLERVTVQDLRAWGSQRLGEEGHAGSGAEIVPGALTLTPDTGPLPPQALVLSYHEGALAVVAELEGTILDHEVKKRLLDLVPPAWHEVLSASLRQKYREVEAVFSDLARDAGGAVPPSLLRAAWEPPFEQLELDDGSNTWRTRASAALESLGASGVAAQLYEWSPLEAARRLLAWLVQMDLLPAALADGERRFQCSTVSLLHLPAEGGRAAEQGPVRLRRLLPIQDELPRLPASWRRKIKGVPRKADEESTTEVGEEEVRAALTTPESKPKAPARRRAREALSRKGEGRSLWRVWLGGDTEAQYPAVAGLFGLAIEAAGFELAASPQEAEVQLRVDSRERGLEPLECEWRLDLPAGRSAEGEWKPQPKAIHELVDSLVAERVRALEQEVPGEPVKIILATYNLRETPTEGAAFRFAAPLDEDEESGERKKRLEEVFGEGLERLHRSLPAGTKTRNLRFYARCGLSVALRVGAIFHRASGFRVECEQSGPRGSAIWSTEGVGEPPEGASVRHEQPRGESAGKELHLLVSVARDVRASYELWSSREGSSAEAVAFTAAEPGPLVVRSADDLVGWAELVRRTIARYQPDRPVRPDPKWPLRFFVASPVALALAIGRQLNAHGRIIAMEFDRKTGDYFEAFDFFA